MSELARTSLSACPQDAKSDCHEFVTSLSRGCQRRLLSANDICRRIGEVMKKFVCCISAVALLAACDGQSSQAPGAQIKIVGSSTVYPFTTAVAENFQRAN